MNAFVEYRPSQRTTVTFGLDNLFDVAGTRERVFFFPDRSNPDPFRFELRERKSHRILSLRVRQNFG